MLRNVSEYCKKSPAYLCEAMVVLSLYKKSHIGYTQYVDNDVYVDDVDVDGQTFLYCSPMDGSFAEYSVEDSSDLS